MHKDLISKPKSSFLSCEKDLETILRKLFVENPYKEDLKRMLIIDTKDCLDGQSAEYQAAAQTSLNELIDKGYICTSPKVRRDEHDVIKSYIIISFDNFIPNDTNPQFRNHTISFDILCYSDCWDIGDYRIRPLKICGCIDAMLNNVKLSGIGTTQLLSCDELILSDELAGYTLTYYVITGGDDVTPALEN